MKNLLSILVLSLLAVFLFVGAASNNASLEITIKGLKSSKGQLMIGVYKDAKSFPDHNKTYKRIIHNLSGKDCKAIKLKISDLKIGGFFALAIYHDENANKKLDKNFFGVPVERYGFSNNARGVFGPPSFEEARFELGKSGVKMTLELK
jgi:uncharacterized protein (DUF2141 family)